MLNPIEINFKLDKTIKRAHSTELMIKSHDINVIEFHISFDGLELTADHTVKVLSVFNDTKSQTKVNCDIVDGKAIYRPDTSIISQYDYVRNYVYVYHGDQSLDMREFTYSVSLSKIDETALKVKTVYDQSYSDLLADFEQALQDYKDTLPQADSVRAEIDVILNQFGVDSQAKLSQYDADAQQVIADNQTTFNLAESNRQATYEQAEDSRNHASEQAVSDFMQTANAQKDAKLGEMQADADSAINQFKQDGANEIADWRVENSAELINLQTEIAKKANKKQEDWITPTLLNGWTNRVPSSPVRFRKNEFGTVEIEGAIKGGTLGVPAFVLPQGYGSILYYPKIFGGPNYGGLMAEIAIAGNNFTIVKSSTTVWISLEGISYKPN